MQGRAGMNLAGLTGLIRVGCVWTLVAAGLGAGAPGQEGGSAAPGLPYVDRNAGLGEGRGYGEWTAAGEMAVYDGYGEGRRVVARLKKGDVAAVESSVVITAKPGVIRMDRDLGRDGLRRGDEILMYGFVNEGFARVWFQGRMRADFDITFVKWPDGGGCGGANCAARLVREAEAVRWVRVSLKSGARGWVKAAGGLLLPGGAII